VAEMMGNTVQVLLDYYVAVKKTKFSLKLGWLKWEQIKPICTQVLTVGG
jgi:hypothetical protein